MEKEDHVLVLKRIHVVYHIDAAPDDRDTIERVHAVHHDACPVYRSIHRAIEVTTEVEIGGIAEGGGRRV